MLAEQGETRSQLILLTFGEYETYIYKLLNSAKKRRKECLFEFIWSRKIPESWFIPENFPEIPVTRDFPGFEKPYSIHGFRYRVFTRRILPSMYSQLTVEFVSI